MNTLQKTIFAAATLFVASTLIVFFIAWPTVKKIQHYNDSIQEERAALENKYTNRRNIKNIIADLKYVDAGLEPIYKQILINKGEEVKFISALETIAAKTNVVQKLTLEKNGANFGDNLLRYSISIALSGNYIDTIKYINALETANYYININSVKFNSTKDKNAQSVDSNGSVKTILQGYVYFAK
jgi:Tfp pilus assembly protein PilO